MLICRILMGIGEASIINLAMPFIDDVAPPLSKTLWFSVFFTVCTSWLSGRAFFDDVAPPLSKTLRFVVFFTACTS